MYLFSNVFLEASSIWWLIDWLLPVHVGWLEPFSTWELHNHLGFVNGVRFVWKILLAFNQMNLVSISHCLTNFFKWFSMIVRPLTFLFRWDSDNIVGQWGSLPHAVPNVVHCTIFLNVGMGCYSIYVDVITHVNLLEWLSYMS